MTSHDPSGDAGLDDGASNPGKLRAEQDLLELARRAIETTKLSEFNEFQLAASPSRIIRELEEKEGLRRERDSCADKAVEQTLKLDAAEAREEGLQRELAKCREYSDYITRQLKRLVHETAPAIIAKKDAAEAEVSRLREALERIASPDSFISHHRNIARQALSPRVGEQTASVAGVDTP